MLLRPFLPEKAAAHGALPFPRAAALSRRIDKARPARRTIFFNLRKNASLSLLSHGNRAFSLALCRLYTV